MARFCSMNAKEIEQWKKMLSHADKFVKSKSVKEAKNARLSEQEKKKLQKENEIRQMLHLFSTRLF